MIIRAKEDINMNSYKIAEGTRFQVFGLENYNFLVYYYDAWLYLPMFYFEPLELELNES